MKAVICGAGIAGLSLAQRLTTIGWDVVVIERSPGPRTQGYMMDFFGLGYDAAQAMGVLPRMQELSYRVEEICYVDESGRRRAGLNYARFERVLNGRLLSIMRPDLELALREQVIGEVDLRYGCGITHIENSTDGVHITLTDGTVLAADLLVGADGIHSSVRHMVFGDEEQFLRYLGYHTAAYIFDDPQVYDYAHDRFCLTDTTERQMGFYGLRDGRVAAFAVHRTPDPTLPDDTQLAVREAYSSLGWVVPRALAKCPTSSELYYDQVAQIEIPQWSRGRVTLLGDACQAVSLLAGQGAALAVAGAHVLGEQLVSAESIDSALTRYQELWQPVITEKQQVARRGVGWFLPSSSLQLWLRRLVLKLTSLPGVDSYVGTRLVGKSHDHVGLRQGSSIESDAQSCTMEDPAGAALERAATSSSSG
ncbi:MAG TPA: FAD-dependent monooxygenase [Actinophytocola sp.]|nr:FAD-dependent monooxygenase [Actinophytocola sp.]